MLALFYSYSLLQLVQEALASRRITIAIARPGGILSLSNMNKVMNQVDPLPLPSVAGKAGP